MNSNGVMRKRIILSLALLMLFSFALMAFPFSHKASAETVLFDMQGAEVRVVDPAGLRFSASIASADYKEENTYGMLVLPKTKLTQGYTEEDLTLENAVNLNALNAVVGEDNNGSKIEMVDKEGYKVLKVVLVDIPETCYGTPILARAYVTESGVTTYSDCVERSVAQVASIAKANNNTEEILDTFIDGAVSSFVATGDKTEYNIIPSQTKQLAITKECADNLSVIYSSDNASVTVDEDGKISGAELGSATVTATLGSKVLTFEVNVTAPTLVADKETINITTIKTLAENDNAVDSTASFGFKVYDGDGDEVTEIDKTQVIFESRNNRQITCDKDTMTFNVKPQVPTETDVAPYTVQVTYMGSSCSSKVNVSVAINSIADMDALAKLAKQGYVHLWGPTFSYKMTADIDYNNTAIIPIAVCGAGGYAWKQDDNLNPQDKSFDATFDGDGHTIKNALIAETLTSGSSSLRNCVFGYTTGTIKNICFDTIKFETQKTMYNSGIFSQMYGTVENILVLNGDINANAASYTEGFNASAFFAGTVAGTINNCIVEASFSASGTPAIPGIIYSYPSGNYSIQNVYAVSPTAHTWVHYHSSGVNLDEDTTYKYNKEANLYEAHPEMFGEGSAFSYDQANGIKLK